MRIAQTDLRLLGLQFANVEIVNLCRFTCFVVVCFLCECCWDFCKIDALANCFVKCFVIRGGCLFRIYMYHVLDYDFLVGFKYFRLGSKIWIGQSIRKCS